MIVTLIALKAVALVVVAQHPGNAALKALKTFLAMTKMESMAIGGIGAYVLFHYPNKLKPFYNNALLIISIVLIPVFVFLTPGAIQDAMYLVYSVLFLVIILNVSGNPASFIKLENKAFVVLGNISYGMYMYHLIVVAFVIKGLLHFGIQVNNTPLSQFVVYSTVIVLTVAVSWLSYNYFEKWFLKLKHKFTVVKSGSSL